MFLDKKPYQIFNKLKDKYTVVTVLVTDKDFSTPLLRTAFKNHREFLINEFKHKGIEIYRWSHDYDSLDGPNPKLGLVYLANDSVIVPGIEVHALVGHNAKGIYV
jgi:hypothetical protein